MGVVLFASDIIATINRPLDGKVNVLTIDDRNAIPVTQRYKGMVVVVQNSGTDLAEIFWLPTSNLTNSGWEEIGCADDGVITIPNWTPSLGFAVNQVVVHDGVLYRAVTSHTATTVFFDDRHNWIALGSSGTSNEHVHTQATPSDRWLIQHNFDTGQRALSIFVVDDNGEQIVGQVNTRLSTGNLLVYDFAEALTGKIYVRF